MVSACLNEVRVSKIDTIRESAGLAGDRFGIPEESGRGEIECFKG
jgi:hypothetical protein